MLWIKKEKGRGDGNLEFTAFKKYKISISGVQKKQLPPEKVLFDRKHLDGMLRPYFDNKSSLLGILLSLISILVTIVLTLLVSDLGTKWGIDKAVWNIAVSSVFGCLLVWSVSVTWKILWLPSFDVVVGDIISQSLTTQDRRFVFLFCAQDSGNSKRVLVQYSNTWKCWLLPSFGKTESSTVSTVKELQKSISVKFSATESDIDVYCANEELMSTKISVKNGKLTTYYFDFYNVKIITKNLSDKMIGKSFNLAGGKFSWMTIQELKDDPNTSEKNGDVIEYLEDKILPNNSFILSTDEAVC